MTATRGFDRVDLPVGGMSCSGCVRSVESSLNRIDGVHASVNLATETATVLFDPGRVGPPELVAAVEAAGYDARLPEPHGSNGAAAAGDDAAALRRRLNVAAAIATPFSITGFVPALRTRRWHWAYLAASIPVVAWAGKPFHARAYKSMRHGATTMDTLVATGSLVGLGAGAVGVIRGRAGAHRYLDVATGVVVSMLSGRVLEAQARGEAGAAIRALLHAGPREVSLLDDEDRERRVPIVDLRVGARFRVRPGEAVATDGIVEGGSSAVDQSLLTGESVPVDVMAGDTVVGGAINAGGPLVVRATRVGSETALARIARLVADAQLGKAPVQRFADRIAEVFVPTVMTLAAGTLLARLRRGDEALEPALSVLVVACPCALGLATPAALMVGVGRGAELGIFIRSPEVLEHAHAVDVILLDKTGTVTTGAMRVVDVVTDGTDPDEALRLAGAIEDSSEHPIGRAVSMAARTHLGQLPEASAFEAATGFGVAGTVGDHDVLVGRRALFQDRGIELPEWLVAASARAEDAGHIAVLVAADGAELALIAIADEIRPTSIEAVARLRALGLEPILVTGDQERTARAVADAVGIDEVIAGALPEDKVAVVRRLQREGRTVAVAGDGINDAPALAAADLGLAVGTGTDVAMEASDLTLASADLRAAADAIRLARATFATIRTNLRWAAGYNVVALPVAASGRVKPTVASVSMAMSSLFVVLNSLRLRSFKGEP